MSTNITRLFKNRKQANEAAAELKRQGFGERSIAVVAGRDPNAAEGTPEPSEASVAAALEEAGLSAKSAQAHAERVLKGAVAVTVRAPFGTAAAAQAAFAKYNGVDLGISDVAAASKTNVSTPFSSGFGWPVLSHHPAPFSALLNWPLLSEERTPKAKLLDDPTPFSNRMGWSVLSEDAAPFSKRWGWRLLCDRATPLSDRFDWKVLSDDATPLSNRFGWEVLSNKPPKAQLSPDATPFSKSLGMRVLSDE